MDLKRIRIDNQGIILQDSKGYLKRIFVDEEKVKMMLDFPQRNLKSLRKEHPKLNEFFDEEGNFCSRLDVIEENTKFLSRPLRIYYGIEPLCNLSCSTCGPRMSDLGDCKKIEKSRGELSEEFLLREIASSGAFQVQLTGGEIALKKQKLPKIVRLTANLGLATILSTNGVWSCIDNRPKFLEDLLRHGNFVQFKISIEGTPEFHDSIRGNGAYTKTLETLSLLSKHPVDTRINATITKQSCNPIQLEHLVGLASKYGAALQLIPLRPVGRATDLKHLQPSKEQLWEYTHLASILRKKEGVRIKLNFDIFDNEREEPDDLIDYRSQYDRFVPFSCGAPTVGLHMNHRGELYPCGFVQDIPELQCGMVRREGSLREIWVNGQKLNEIRNSQKPERCLECYNYQRRRCTAGCWVMSWVSNKRIDGIDPYCVIK